MDYRDFTIVLPTLNEEGTIGILVRRLIRRYHGIRIMVMDDGSTDRTEMAVSAASKLNSNVSFFNRKKAGRERGLTASVVDGILKSRTRFVIVMDADLQHPPEIVGRISKGLSAGHGLVVAIRSSVKGWELHRKIVSMVLMGIGYAILVATGRSRCNDIFSGFFGVDRRLFTKKYNENRGRFIGGGYKVLYDFLKCNRSGSVSIGQVPYSFGLRESGASKAGLTQGIMLFKSFLT